MTDQRRRICRLSLLVAAWLLVDSGTWSQELAQNRPGGVG